MMLALSLLAVSTQASGYPRTANLWGCSPASRDYDQWARCDLPVLGDGSPDVVRDFERQCNLKAARCQRITEAGPISWAGSSQPFRNRESTTHTIRNAAVNRGFGTCSRSTRLRQAAT